MPVPSCLRAEFTDVPGDTSTTATINVGSPLLGTIETATDEDWYQISLTAGVHYCINQLPDPDTGWQFQGSFAVYDAGGTLLVGSYDREYWQSAFLDFVPTADGNYFIAAAGDRGGGDGGYWLAVDEDIGETIPPTGLTLSQAEPITGHISAQPDFDDDLYRVELDAGRVATFRFMSAGLSSSLEHAYLQLFDSSGQLIEVGTDEISIDQTQGGTYYISIGGVSASDSRLL